MSQDPSPPLRSFPNPYPEPGWRSISHFRYLDPLILYRCAEAVRTGSGREANYVVGWDYRVTFKVDGVERDVVVPRGMLTDLASVPRAFRWYAGRVGPHLEASIVHDYLYMAWQDLEGRGAEEIDRRFADDLFLQAMLEAKMRKSKAWALYSAVRIFGAKAYRDDDTCRYVSIPAIPDRHAVGCPTAPETSVREP